MPLVNQQKEVALALTVKIGGAYSANDVVGGLLTFDVANAAGSGCVQAVRLVDDDNENAAMTLYLFNAAPTVFADDAAFAPTVADLKKLIGIVTIAAGNYVTLNGNSVALLQGPSSPNVFFKTATGMIYGYLVCTGTPTYTAATDLHLTLFCQMDGGVA